MLVTNFNLVVVIVALWLPRGRRSSMTELWRVRPWRTYLTELVQMPGAVTLMAVGRPTTIPCLGAGRYMLPIVP